MAMIETTTKQQTMSAPVNAVNEAWNSLDDRASLKS